MTTTYSNFSDMKLQTRLPMPTEASKIPLTYRIGDTVYHGIPDQFCPVSRRHIIDANITQYTYTGSSPEGIAISVEALQYNDFPVVEWIAYFSNASAEKSPILSDIKWDVSVNGIQPYLYYSNGDTCRDDGYETYLEPIDKCISLTPVNGVPNQGAFPYMRICMKDWFINLAIGWSGCWNATFTPSTDGASIQIGQKRCHMSILKGETIRTPRVTWMAAGQDDSHARNLWRKWYFAHIIPKENGKPIPPKMCMHVWNVDGEEFTGASTKTQSEGLLTYIQKGLKPDIWWMDAGWYPCDHKWAPTVGTWHCDYERFPNGMGEIGQLCEENDVQFLVWFEPERVCQNTDIYNNHPEWLLSIEGYGNHLFNLAIPEARKWLSDYVNDRIDEYHIHIYRQDFNFDPMPFWIKYETEDRIGAIENLHVQGYLAYWDSLIERHPGLWIDSCASGGRRNDLDTMRRSVPLHYTDVGYGNHPIKQKQHRLMFEWIPYFRAHNNSWDNPDGTYANGHEPNNQDAFSYHCALAPSMTNTLFYLGDEELFEIGRKMTPIWRRAAELELRGDYYPLTLCRKDPHDWYGMQFDDPQTGDGFVQIIRNTLVEDSTFELHMQAIRPGCQYTFENMETGETMILNSQQLQKGVSITLERRAGVIWFYHT